MPQTFDLVLSRGTVVNHDGVAKRDVGVRDGRVAAIGDLSAASAGERIDCAGLHVLPGVIDSQVHFREPGPVHKEDLETGSRAAVLGGVTAVFEMPNTDPTTTTESALADKVRRAHGRMHCDFAFWVGGTHDNVANLTELERLPGAAGIKVFMGSSTGRLLVADDEGVLAVLKAIRRRAAFHSEDETRLNERKPLRVPGDPSSHPVWRDETTALICTERLIRLAREARAQVHVLHVSTREEMELLASARDVASCEATPHHLTLSADDYARLGTKLQMNPPVRGPEHRDGIWRGLVLAGTSSTLSLVTVEVFGNSVKSALLRFFRDKIGPHFGVFQNGVEHLYALGRRRLDLLGRRGPESGLLQQFRGGDVKCGDEIGQGETLCVI